MFGISKVGRVQAPWFQKKVCTQLRRMFAALFIIGLTTLAMQAQTGGQGGIQGTVTDATGAVIPGATVTMVNEGTSITTVRTASSAGLFDSGPILPGTYRITIAAPGFQQLVQQNFIVDAMKVTGFNPMLSVGSADTSVTVSDSPPAIETTNATLGGVMENKTYSNLPIQMGGQQRDATAFATLMPGAQSGSRAPVIGGTSNYLAELYLDGLPVTIATQQGDNRVIFNSVPIEAVEQFQVLTSSIPAEYQGAGLLNFTVKSGSKQYHGSANMYIRNTIFDTWCFTCKAATYQDANGVTRPAKKPYENQNEIALTAGGPIPFTRNKGFFQFTFDRYHGRAGVNPGLLSIPTLAMRNGDFSQLLAANGGPGYIIYNPLTTAECTSHNTGGAPCRYAYGQSYSGTPGPNGGATGTPTNVIPAAQISPIAKYMQSFLPTPSNGNFANNYLGGVATGYDNWSYVWRADYDLTASQRISFVVTKGSRLNVPFTVGANPTLPLPYAQASLARVVINLANIEHAWTIRPSIVNQFKFGFLQMGGPPVTNPTSVVPEYAATAAGITGLPPGQSSTEFPGATFSGSNAPTKWTANGASAATYTSVSNGYTFLDNLLVIKGQHAVTFGFQLQFLQANASTYDGPSGIVPVTYNVAPTALPSSSTADVANTGYSYASYLLGGVGSSSLTIQSFGIAGGRYRPMAPYVQDDWKVTPKLTLNLGLRWDYLPPYHEVLDRFSYLNPGLTNSITGNAGMVQFAGNRGAGVSCECRTPVQTYWQNWGPRIGAAYSLDNKTVLRGGFGLFYSHGGGVGGRAGAAAGTGSLGYSASPNFTETTLAPAFWLNNSAAFTAAGLGNTTFGGPGYTLPTPTGATAAGQVLNTGNYVSNGSYVQPGSVTYADPYISGRAPTFAFWNVGLQRAITNALTISMNYAGSESHFLATGSSSARGYWSNQLNPTYLAGLGAATTASGAPLLSAAATPANVARAAAAMPGITSPYPGYTAAAALSTRATIQQMLVAFPQYSGVSDLWGQNIGNNAYHSFQMSVNLREWKGLSYTLNYTYAKNLGDDGTFRSGYDIPASAINAGGRSFKQGQADRSWTTISIPQNLAAFGVYRLPFGKSGIGANNWAVRSFGGGWLLSGIFRYASGTPLAVTSASCYSVAGTCMPDINPNYAGVGTNSARINGSWDVGATGSSVGAQQKIDPTAFVAPPVYGNNKTCTTCIAMIGNAPRTRAFDLQNPSYYNLDMGIKREFPLTHERFKMLFEANCLNVTNKHTFGGIGTTLAAASTTASNYGSFAATNSGPNAAFGRATTASGNRDWQLAAHITF